ncbi:MAG TPA: sialidase family protein [Nitrososphaeraceae archaeon]|nr:sialidase family protein [Nitrososphaeraceae archaeon]
MPIIRGNTINHRVTVSESPNYARSESSIAVNPRNPYNMVAASKRFTDPSKYQFSLAVYTTFDGGHTWKETNNLELPPECQVDGGGTSDPALAWDISQYTDKNKKDIVNLVALPFKPVKITDPDNPDDPEKATTITVPTGIAVYQSTDGGNTWGSPTMIHQSVDPPPNGDRVDDKQWAVGDNNPSSPYFGRVYAAWDDGPGVGNSYLAFARTLDHGKNWIGMKDKNNGDQKAGANIPGIKDSGAPELSVASDGTIYIVWLGNNNSDVKFVKSIDGGDSFTEPMVVAKGIVPLSSPYLENIHRRSHLAGGSFRVVTVCTGCTGAANNVMFAWADYREGISRIYYRLSTDGGTTWEGPPSGQPLLVSQELISEKDQHEFHPQLISTPSGEIGCAFYEFGPKGRSGFPAVLENYLIDVVLAISVDDGKTFSDRITVTNYPWDPAINAPFSGGDKDVTFIGEYFGLDASPLGFFPLWTDTRTGMQEIFVARVNEIHTRLSGVNPATIPELGED